MYSRSRGQTMTQHPLGAPWTLHEASQFLGVSERHLNRLIEQGEVTSFNLGRRRLIADSEVRRVAEGGVR